MFHHSVPVRSDPRTEPPLALMLLWIAARIGGAHGSVSGVRLARETLSRLLYLDVGAECAAEAGEHGVEADEAGHVPLIRIDSVMPGGLRAGVVVLTLSSGGLPNATGVKPTRELREPVIASSSLVAARVPRVHTVGVAD